MQRCEHFSVQRTTPPAQSSSAFLVGNGSFRPPFTLVGDEYIDLEPGPVAEIDGNPPNPPSLPTPPIPDPVPDAESDCNKPARILQTSKGHIFCSSLLQILFLLLLTSLHMSSGQGPFPESTDCIPGLQDEHSVRSVCGVHCVVVEHVGVVRVHSVVRIHTGVFTARSGEQVDFVLVHCGDRVVHCEARVVHVGERKLNCGERVINCDDRVEHVGDLVEHFGERVEHVDRVEHDGELVVHVVVERVHRGVVDTHGPQGERSIAGGERLKIGVHSVLILGEQVVVHCVERSVVVYSVVLRHRACT